MSKERRNPPSHPDNISDQQMLEAFRRELEGEKDPDLKQVLGQELTERTKAIKTARDSKDQRPAWMIMDEWERRKMEEENKDAGS